MSFKAVFALYRDLSDEHNRKTLYEVTPKFYWDGLTIPPPSSSVSVYPKVCKYEMALTNCGIRKRLFWDRCCAPDGS